MQKFASQSIWLFIAWIAFSVATKTVIAQQQLTKEKIWQVLDEICKEPGLDEKSYWPPNFASIPSGKKLDELKKSCSISDVQIRRWNKVCADWNQAISNGSQAEFGDITLKLTTNSIGTLLPEEQKKVLDYYSKIHDQYRQGLQLIFSPEQKAKMDQFKISQYESIFKNKALQDFLEVDQNQRTRIDVAIKDHSLPIPGRMGSTFGAKVLSEAEKKKIQRENEAFERKRDAAIRKQMEACLKVLTDVQNEKYLILMGKKPLPN
ncbi:MAG: hypothetical protein U0930_10380 [Pirellulales bacterium]